ncbi:ADP-ribose pyrophosphatase [Vibrio ishigakensis]|uniref:ADP-ribose pyrophosphatase n=1 Tax=Vibrio ishigakensis TaxID=1481914 RepID=A0A0B8QBC3_9VIBR|nr:ADP-ribose diphosphatase [Vibrio ishigakensis]GAM55055.1 ADP-ribose pyrophosphatase [Vibrio ishigakensis]GAM76960.1 ADP-ribose pyrophosphatase [Vibrio ishigakensis]
MSKPSSYPSYSNQDVEIIEQETLYQGFFKMVKYRFRHKLFEGGWSDIVQRELLERGHAVAVLPYDPVADKVIMVEQIRVGALEQARPWQLEIVAGMLDKDGESAEEVAQREAFEEAGLELSNIQHISGYYPSAGGCSERLELYIGQVNAPEQGGVFGVESENEDIKVHILTREEAYELVKNGTIENAASIITLQWLMLNHQQVRTSWLNR